LIGELTGDEVEAAAALPALNHLAELEARTAKGQQ
jgi:hypothetical protein